MTTCTLKRKSSWTAFDGCYSDKQLMPEMDSSAGHAKIKDGGLCVSDMNLKWVQKHS